MFANGAPAQFQPEEAVYDWRASKHMEQMRFNFDTAPAVSPSSRTPRISPLVKPTRRPVDALMAGEGAWAFGENAERCFMRFAGKTIQVVGQTGGVSLSVPFTTSPNPSLVGWGAWSHGKIELEDWNVVRAWVGRFGIRDMQHKNGRKSAYALNVVERHGLVRPDLAAQAMVLAQIAAAHKPYQELPSLIGRHVIIRLTGLKDPVVKSVETQYLPVTQVTTSGKALRIAGDDWHLEVEGVRDVTVSGGDILLTGPGLPRIAFDITTTLQKIPQLAS